MSHECACCDIEARSYDLRIISGIYPVCEECYKLADEYMVKEHGLLPVKAIFNMRKKYEKELKETDEKYQQVVKERNELLQQKFQLETKISFQQNKLKAAKTIMQEMKEFLTPRE
jgi:hypothetical protein